jgi:uncharacterized membrane protein YkoI
MVKASTHSLIVGLLVLGLASPSASAQQRGAVPIHEQTSGLLAEAQFPAAPARLNAMAQVPGARIVAATIERHAEQLIYSFDLEYPDNGMLEHVQINAVSGEIILVEYCVKLDEKGELRIKAAPELVTEVRVGFLGARGKAMAEVPGGRLVESALRVQRSRHLYVFDIEVSEGSAMRQVLVDAYSGDVVSVEP